MTLLPAVPSPTSLATPDEIAEAGASLVAWAKEVDDLEAVREVSAKWAAITTYIRETQGPGIFAAEAVKRRLEARIGALLRPAKRGRPAKALVDVIAPERAITRHDRDDFRKMAANEDVMEDVIAVSDDDSPPTRARVLGAIRAQEPQAPQRAGTGERIVVVLRSDVDAFVRERADANGETPSSYIERQMDKAYAAHQAYAGRQQRNARPDPKAGVAPIPKAAKRPAPPTWPPSRSSA